MSPSRCHAILGLAVFLAIVPAARAQQKQQPMPQIGYVYPAGGRQGASFEVRVGGQFLEGVADVYVSGAGVQATVVEHTRPMTQKEAGELRDKLKELQDKRAATAKNDRRGGSRSATQPAWTDEDEKMAADLRQKLSTFVPRDQLTPAIAETVRLQVTIAPDAEPGERDLRLRTPMGLTNPRVFCVDPLPEFSKKPAQIIVEPKDGKGPPKRFLTERTAPEPEMSVTLPAIVNGQIMPGAVDRFHFKARKGQRLVVAAEARALVPYLPDAVPGWFQATLALYDAKGKELAYDDDYRFHPDPVLFYQIPRDGEYAIEIKDAIYRGRQDFVYRIALGELPFVTSVFPLGCKAGAQAKVETVGWNLPQASLAYDARSRSPGVYQISVAKGDVLSNRVPFAVDALPECREKEPNNQPDIAQPVKLPIIVNGRIDKPGDWDMFSFEGRAGDEIVAEVHARRLDSPLDSVLKLTDAVGRQLAFNDDHEDKGAGLTTHYADSWLRAKLPAAGIYYVHLGDAQDKGGPEYAYRLRISAPRPDFELRVVPSSVTVRGGTSPLTVYALRKDGFSGEIELSLNDAPAGFKLSGARVPAKQDQVRVTLTVPPMAPKEPLGLSLEGRATIQGHEVVRPAVPAEDMMQAFAYRHLVPAKELLVSVLGRAMPRRTPRILSATPVKIPAGGTARLQLGVPANAPMGKIQIELSEPPDGISIRSVSPAGEDTEVVLQSDAAKVKPGLKGNLIVTILVERTSDSEKGKGRSNMRRMPVATLPAVPFEIVAR